MYEEKDKEAIEFGLFNFVEVEEKGLCYLEIYEQAECGFDYEIYFRGDELAKRYTPTCDFKIIVGSHSCVEFIEYSSKHIDLYLQGREDFGRKNKVLFPIKYKDKIEKALRFLGGVFMNDKPNEEKEGIKSTDMQLKGILKDGIDIEQIVEEMISKVDINTFMKIIYNRASITMPMEEVNQEITLSKCKDYLRQWAYNKAYMYIALGNNIKIEKEIEVEPDENFFREKITELKNNFPLYRPIFENIGLEDYMNNKYRSWISSGIFRGASQIKDDMKLTKLFSLYGNKELDIELSKIYQEKNKAMLCISIDPIDYLTVSINKSGWKSCHNFLKGAYRDAPIAYMFDEASMVAYSYTSITEYKDMLAPFKWNSKQWRQMIYVDKESSAVVFSREYPYESPKNKEEIRILYEEVISKNLGWENRWIIYNNANKPNIIIQDLGYVYNDVKNGFNHKAIVNKFDNKLREEKTIYIGTEYYDKLGGY